MFEKFTDLEDIDNIAMIFKKIHEKKIIKLN